MSNMIFKFWEEQSPNNIIITQLKAAQLKKKSTWPLHALGAMMTSQVLVGCRDERARVQVSNRELHTYTLKLN